MALHTWHHQGPHKPRNCATFTLNSHWGRAATGKKKSLFMRAGSLRPCPTLCNPVDCGLPGFSVREGGSPGKNTGAYWPILVVIPFQSIYFLLPQLPTPLSTWCGQNPCDPSSCTTSTPGPHRGKPKSSRAASGVNPSGQPTCRGGNKTTIETQGQCG